MTDLFGLLIVAMLVGAGIYALYSGFRLRKEYYLFENKFLYPANCPPASCTDVSGFIRFISPRILLFGILCVLLGGISAFVTFGLPAMGYTLPTWVDLCMIPLILIPFVWYCILQAKAAKLYW